MRISDWSSDVCSSDVQPIRPVQGDCRNGISHIVENVGIGHDPRFLLVFWQCCYTAGNDTMGRRHDHQLRTAGPARPHDGRSEEHTSELQSLMRISYAVFCLKKKKTNKK